MSLQWQSMVDLWQRYRRIFAESWSRRHELDSPAREADELAFLPANLELAETPLHPAPRVLMRVLVATVLIIILIALLGRLDIVAVAPGKLQPNASVKVIQPAVGGVVHRILVQNGQHVAAGQLLMELDASQASADTDKAHTARLDNELSMARAQAILGAMQSHTPPRVPVITGLSDDRQREAQRLAEGAYGEYLAKMAALDAELQKRQAELVTTQAEIAKLTATAPLARKQANDYQSLANGNYVSRHDYLDKEQAALNQEHELAAQQSHARELSAGVEEQQREMATTSASFRRELLDEIDKAQQQLQQSRDDEAKATVHQQFMQLAAPVEGTVQQLGVHTVGGVVTAAQTVMEIVPNDSLKVVARVSNKDIGFVYPGQLAIIKIETFPYTRYGYLQGRVIKVSNDAVQDRSGNFSFEAEVSIPTNTFQVEHKLVNLTPGMQVTVEIKTGRQSVWRYFLSPLIATSSESLRER